MLARPSLAGPLATERVSINSVGQEGDRASRMPSVTGDGRMVLFASEATNLAPGDGNGAQDIFLHDWSTGLTQRVSLAHLGGDPNGASAWPKISADGSTIAFASEASNLVPGDNNNREDVFVLDLGSGEIELISVSNAGAQGDAPSSQPVISGDGRFVAFVSSATNLFSGATSGYKEVFLLDRSTGMLQWVSRPLSGTDNDNDSGELAISQDGNWVAFSSVSTKLVSNDTNGSRDVFLWSRPSGSLARISVTTAGLQANGPSYTPSLSAEGRFVGFRSHASNLVPDDTNYMGDIFRLDRQSGEILRASVTSSGQQSLNGPSDEPVISSDGRFLAFKSYASDLVPDDGNSRADIFLRDMQGATTLVSVDSAGVQSNGNNYSPAMSSDGAAIVFYSEADNLDLLLADGNAAGDVFAHGDPPQPEPTATPTETPTSEPTATIEPTLTPTVEPSPTFTLVPTNTATPVPTSVPPTYTATPVPTTLPPTYTATPIPTTLPPTYTVTPVPTDPPTPIPTYTATSIPTSTPTTPPTSGMAPVIELKSEASLNEGGELSLSGNFADPDSTRWEASVDYGDGEGFVSLALNDKRGFKLSRRYGDDGEYRVTVRVKDESGAYGEALLLVKVKNKNPLLENDSINALEECDKEVRESGRSRGRSACRVNDWYVATAGQPTVFTFDMEDPGSDDLLVHWSFGDDAAYFNAGDQPDPDHSPNGTYPFRVTHSASYVFDKPGVKYVTVEVKDDDGGVVSQKIKVLVRGTESCRTSLGYWIQRFKKDGFSIYSGELRAHLSILSAFVTSSFGEFNPEMIDRLEQFVLTEAGDSAQARAQLITAWLNFTNGSVDWDEVIDDADGHRDLPYGDVLREILAILLESNPSRDDYKRAIELAQSINLHRRGSFCPAYDD